MLSLFIYFVWFGCFRIIVMARRLLSLRTAGHLKRPMRPPPRRAENYSLIHAICMIYVPLQLFKPFCASLPLYKYFLPRSAAPRTETSGLTCTSGRTFCASARQARHPDKKLQEEIERTQVRGSPMPHAGVTVRWVSATPLPDCLTLGAGSGQPLCVVGMPTRSLRRPFRAALCRSAQPPPPRNPPRRRVRPQREAAHRAVGRTVRRG